MAVNTMARDTRDVLIESSKYFFPELNTNTRAAAKMEIRLRDL